MVSPSLRQRPTSPEHTVPAERVINVSSESPALLRSASSREDEEDEEDAIDEEESDANTYDESVTSSGLTELELSEYEYHHGRQAIPMQSPGERADIDLDVGRRRSKLPSLHRRQLFEGSDSSFERPSGRGRMMQRITFRRRKAGEQDVFWTGVFISNVLSLIVMSVLMFYLLQTDFFESHQTDLFGTTVDDRFTVVAPENEDAKIYMKSGYSTSRYSESMIAFGNGELKIGRRALAPTDVQGFYGVVIANNGSATFTNKLSAPFVKTDYLHAARAVVFDDGTVMTTAANLSGGINEVGDLNLVSKTGSITLSAGGKPVLKVDPDATVNLLNSEDTKLEAAGITFDAAKGAISIASTFKIHHDENTTVVASTHPIELNSTRLVVGSSNATKALITVPSIMKKGSGKKSGVYKKMALAIVGQSSENQSHGGDVLISGGDGVNRGGNVVLTGGESAENEDGDITYGTILINAKLDRTTVSTTEIGTHSKSHKVNLHGAVSINNATESGHGTKLYIGGGNVLATSKNVTVNNLAANGSSVVVKSHHVHLRASTAASLSMTANETHLVGSRTLVLGVAPAINSSQTASISLDDSGHVELNASRDLKLSAHGANSSINFVGAVRFGGSSREDNGSNAAGDMTIDDGMITIDADSLIVGGAGNTDAITFVSDDITIGNLTQTSNVIMAGENASILSKHIHVGTSVSSVFVEGKLIKLRAGESSGNNTKSATLSMRGGTISMSGHNVIVGDKNSESIVVGSPSSSRVSISSVEVEVGASAKTVSVGDKATTVKIGSDSSSIDIRGKKLTFNGKPFDGRRQLESSDSPFFVIAQSDDVTIQFPAPGDETHIPLRLMANAKGVVLETAGDIQVTDYIAGSTTTHVRLSLSLASVRLRVDPGVTEATQFLRTPKLRCRVYRMRDPAAPVLEVISPLEPCEDETDCRDGFFLGTSSQRIVPIEAADRLSLRCATSFTGSSSQLARAVLIDNVQLDISSL